MILDDSTNTMYARRRTQGTQARLELALVKFWVKIGAITAFFMTLLYYIANGGQL